MSVVSRIFFPHGLGDCANFALLLRCYRERGLDVRVVCEDNKKAIFEIAGIPAQSRNDPAAAGRCAYHPWWEPDSISRVTAKNILEQNKIWRNLKSAPLPNLPAPADELWRSVLQQKNTQMFSQHKSVVADSIKDLPRPILLVHACGNTSTDQKNMPEKFPAKIAELFLSKTAGSVIFLDWDNRVNWVHSSRTRHINFHFDGKLSTPEALMGLMASADLLLGIDSGPFHLAGMIDMPSIGVWFGHHPLNYAIPRENCLNIVAVPRYANLWGAEKFNIVPENKLTPEYIVDAILLMLAAPKFKLPKGADVQLQLLVNKCNGGIAANTTHIPNVIVDRHISFSRVFEHLVALNRPPKIVETGCIRSDDDWAGAGYSTFLFGLFAQRFSGTLLSADISSQNVAYAKKVCETLSAVNIVQVDSVQALRSLDHTVDLAYLDSMDANIVGHAEHGLAETQQIEQKISADGIIVFDDTVFDGVKFLGKGALGAPWLLKRGWQIMFMGHQIVLRRN